MKEHRPYKLEDYNPKWKETFNEVSEKVKGVLGDLIVEVEHIGSTSVVGMVAKPQVDILVVVKDLELLPNKYQEMLDTGFTHHGRGYVAEDDDYFSLNTPDGIRVSSIHILQEGNPKIEEYKVFRDYLRTHPEERDLYISVKRELYGKHSDNYRNYDGGKKEVITGIKERSKEWFSKKNN